MADYAVVINFAFEGEQSQSILLDTVNDVNISDSSTITTHPIISGDTIADHMIRDPSTITITGTLSLNGSVAAKSLIISNNKVDPLLSQEVFTRIKNEGVFCEIYKIAVAKSNIRFMRRPNMVLNNITWIEGINSIAFTFTFTEVLTAEVKEYEVDESDSFLPNINEPKSLNFTETLIDWDAIDSIVFETEKKTKVMTNDFINGLKGLGAGAIVGMGVGYAIANILVKWAVVGGIKGLLIAGVVIIASSIIGSIVKFVKSKKYRIRQFKYYRDSRFDKEVKRQADFVSSIHEKLDELNKDIQVYRITENEEQECLVTIDNNYYNFILKRNNVSNTYSLNIEDLNENPVGQSMQDIRGALAGFDECTDSNFILKTDNDVYAYLMYYPEEGEEDQSNLTNYYILVTSIKPSDFNDKIVKIVRRAILY